VPLSGSRLGTTQRWQVTKVPSNDLMGKRSIRLSAILRFYPIDLLSINQIAASGLRITGPLAKAILDHCYPAGELLCFSLRYVRASGSYLPRINSARRSANISTGFKRVVVNLVEPSLS
jgi:hypothetical protein